MIVIMDDANRNMYFISNGTRKIPYEEATDVLASFSNENISCVFAKQISVKDLITHIGNSKENIIGSNAQSEKRNTSYDTSSAKYIVPSKPSAVIVAGLTPTLMFENGYDYKSVESLKNTYGGHIPHQVEKLINSGRLIFIDESSIAELEHKKQESIKIAQRKHKNGGKKVDSDDSDLNDEDGRLARKATRINL